MKKLFFLLVALVAVVVVIIFLGKTPAKGKINHQPKNKQPRPTTQEYIRYDAPNISFAYENKYVLREKDGMWELDGNSGVPIVVVVTYRTNEAATLDEVSGVKMRQVKNVEYAEEKYNDGIVFTKTNPLELTYFYFDNGRALTIAMTVNSNETKIYRDEFVKMIDSVTIKP